MGSEMNTFIKKISTMMARKTKQTYQDTVSFIRKRYRIELLRTTLIALRGHRGRFFEKATDAADLDLNIAGREGGELGTNDFFNFRAGF